MISGSSRTLLLVGLLLSLGSVAVLGCADEFNDCGGSASCKPASGGAAGDAGAGGAGRARGGVAAEARARRLPDEAAARRAAGIAGAATVAAPKGARTRADRSAPGRAALRPVAQGMAELATMLAKAADPGKGALGGKRARGLT